MIGETLSHFKVTAKIGEGGMGEVYRAQDTKLGREVALKILPELFASDGERMARFQREAQVLASLNHPHIAAIYEIGEASRAPGSVEEKLASPHPGAEAPSVPATTRTVHFLAMELVEGETLDDRIQRGPIPVDQALPLAVQIAQALEGAHDKGIIHRDLKPANVKLTPAGQVKVLDFGLAKALAGDSASADSHPDLTQSPTLTAQMTAAGMLMGTAAYMSPEQARGQEADRRADIWAFGVVLMEMLTGRRTFAGDTATDVLGGIVYKEPDWSELPADAPPPVRRLLQRCLRKDATKRLQAIGDARILIEEYLADPRAALAAAPPPSQPAWRRALPWAVAGAWGLAVAAMALLWPAAPPTEPAVRLQTTLDETSLFPNYGASAVLSPDGRRLAYVIGTTAAEGRLYLRSLDQLKGTELVVGGGGNVPYNPFFSPDGQWLGFVTPAELKKMPITGGTPITLCEVSLSRGATWLPDDTIVFAPDPQSGLFRVPATGGEPEPLTTLEEEKGEVTHRWPHALPGGKALLFTSHAQSAGNFDDASIEALVLATGERKVVHRGGTYARYLPSGHLVYVNGGTLFAVPFDPESLETRGSPAPVVEGIASGAASGGAQYSFSETGDLTYVSGTAGVPEYPILEVNRDGASTPLWQEAGPYAAPQLSPDGTRLALSVLRDENLDVWVYDLERHVATRLTFHEGYDGDQVWSPDGQYLAFTSDREGTANVYRKRADGSGEAERLTDSSSSMWPTSWSSDGRFLSGILSDQAGDIWVLPLEGEAEPEPFLASSFSEGAPAFSPDGRWIAYDSNESGRVEVYVRPFPTAGGKWQVSDGGGGQPLWSPDGRELYYRTDEGLMVATVETAGGTFRAGSPRPLFQGSYRGGAIGMTLGAYRFPDYAVTPDGRRFVLFPQEAVEGEAGQVTLVFNWFDELARTLGNGR